MSVLEINNLSKNYGNLRALTNLSLTIEKGQVYGLLGPNGSGKTSTLAIILGILKESSGSFKWFDGEYGGQPNKKIGALLETPNFYPYKTAVENLEIIHDIKGTKHTKYDELLELVNLAHRKDSPFRSYSLGMKQRLAIAATLIGDPQVIIFDEPTNGLDPQGIAEVRTILRKVADGGKTVIMASHILSEVEKICSHVAIIKNGILLDNGPVAELLKSNVTLELQALNNENLIHFLTHFQGINNVSEKNTLITCTLDEKISIQEIAKTAFDQGIIFTHIVSKKKKLEEAFLEITKDA